jgi:hypothetical protein
LKLFAIARYNQFGQPNLFYNFFLKKWQTELNLAALTVYKSVADDLAEKEGGFTETYNLQREMPKVYRDAKLSDWGQPEDFV